MRRQIMGENPSPDEYPVVKASGTFASSASMILKAARAATVGARCAPQAVAAAATQCPPSTADGPGADTNVLELANVYRECKRILAKGRELSSNMDAAVHRHEEDPIGRVETAETIDMLRERHKALIATAKQLRERMTPEQVERALALAEQ